VLIPFYLFTYYLFTLVEKVIYCIFKSYSSRDIKRACYLLRFLAPEKCDIMLEQALGGTVLKKSVYIFLLFDQMYT